MLFLHSILLAVLGGVVFLPLLDYSLVFQVSEAREGQIIFELFRGDSFILPLRNGDIIPSKPPLFHWIGVWFAWLLGGVDEAVIRLPSACAAIALCLLIFRFTARLIGYAEAWVASLALLTSYGFFRLASDARVDMVFAFFVCAAIFVWLEFVFEDSRFAAEKNALNARRAFGVLCGLAILAKGPLGFVFPTIIVLSVSIYHRCGRSALYFLSWSLPWVLLVCLPWYCLATLEAGWEFLERQLFFENIQRLVGSKDITSKPPWFYLQHFWSQSMPWGFILLALSFLEWRSWRKGFEESVFSSPEKRSWFVSFGIWLIVGILFFSLSVGKRRAYLVLILPAVAIMVSIVLLKFLRRLPSDVNYLKIYGLFLCLITVGLLFAFFGISLTSFPTIISSKAELLFSFLPDVLLLKPWCLSFYLLIFGFGGAYFWWIGAGTRCSRKLFSGIAFYLLFMMLVIVNTGLALKSRTHTYRGFAYRLAHLVPESDRIVLIKKPRDEFFDGLMFYFQRHVSFQHPDEQLGAPGIYLARAQWYAAFGGRSSSRILSRGGRPKDSPKNQFVLFSYK